jgi:hypothetical protein
MKWTTTKKEKKDLKSLDGKVRYVKRFLFFPRTIKHYNFHPGGKESTETRWLELVTIEQKYYYFPASHGFFWFLGTEMPYGSDEHGRWYDEKFIDKKKEPLLQPTPEEIAKKKGCQQSVSCPQLIHCGAISCDDGQHNGGLPGTPGFVGQSVPNKSSDYEAKDALWRSRVVERANEHTLISEQRKQFELETGKLVYTVDRHVIFPSQEYVQYLELKIASLEFKLNNKPCEKTEDLILNSLATGNSIDAKNKDEHDRLVNYAKSKGFETVPTLTPSENKIGSTVWRESTTGEESYFITYTPSQKDKNSDRWIDAHLISLGINPESIGWIPLN